MMKPDLVAVTPPPAVATLKADIVKSVADLTNGSVKTSDADRIVLGGKKLFADRL